MKKAFTMMELIFVLIVIGILVAVIMPEMKSNKLREAAIQVVSHIRYTQHLAMVDDKFDSSNPNWYKERWRIRFKEELLYSNLSPAGTYPKIWAYSIFGDTSHDRNPNLSEMARNPLNINQYMSGGYNDTLHLNDARSMKEMRLGPSYGINNILFSGGCRSNITYIYFDHLGRPSNSIIKNAPYESATTGWHKLLTSECKISLCKGSCTGTSSDTEVIISIHPETGYVEIL